MGTPEDLAMQEEQRRKDDAERQQKIASARKIIHKQNYSVNTDEVEKLLKPTSLVPSMNAFSERLSPRGLDVYSLIAVDILHEVEIGVWKSLFIQLLRVLEAIDKSFLNVLNGRFRQIPTFGRDTIQRFRNNVSEMKQLAAQDYEDILQCAMAAFEGLIPGEHGGRVQDLLFIFAHWHSLAKLRLHTDDTLSILDEWTVKLGAESRLFVARTCDVYETQELKREYQSRNRNEARKKGKAVDPKTAPGMNTKAMTPVPPTTNVQTATSEVGIQNPKSGTSQAAPSRAKGRNTKASNSPKKKNTKSKAHTSAATAPSHIAQAPSSAPGARAEAVTVTPSTSTTHLSTTGASPSEIQTALADSFGTPEDADSCVSVIGADTRRLKTWSLNTSKFHALGDVSNYIRRFGTTDSYSTQLSERFHRFPKARYRRTNKKQTSYQISRIQTRQSQIKRLRKQLSPASKEGPSESERDTASYFIGKSQNKPISLSHFLRVNANDPALRGFYPKLRRYLLPQIIERLLQEAKRSPDDYRAALPVLKDLHATGAFTAAHSNATYIHSDRFYHHSILQINYTTYDCRRAQDTLNPYTSRRNVMCLRPKLPADPSPLGPEAQSEEPQSEEHHGGRFVYARVLAVIHVNVTYMGPGMLDHRPRRFNLLWVRWYEALDSQFTESTLWTLKRMERVELRLLKDPEACDFIDPSDVVRAAHIIPRFSEKMRYDETTPANKIYSKCAKEADDWKEYYINPFVDRDMMMRYHWGMAVGHVHTGGLHKLGEDGDLPGVGAAISLLRVGATGPRAMDIDSPGGDDVGGAPPGTGTDSEDSAYDRPRGSDGGSFLEYAMSNNEEVPDIQEPESSDEGDEIYK